MAKTAKLSNIAILGAIIALFFAAPADALFSYDTLALRQDTGTGYDITSEISNPFGLQVDAATDSAGNSYFLHFQSETGDTIPRLLITKVGGNSDTFDTVITVARYAADTIFGTYKASLAVNQLSGAIYVALLVKSVVEGDTSDTGVYLYSSANGGATFTRTGIARHLIDTGAYGFIRVATFGSTATDSVFILVPGDTPGYTTYWGSSSTGNPMDSGIFLLRCSSAGAVVDSALVIPAGMSTQADSVGTRNAPTNAKMVAIGQNKVAIISMGKHGGACDTGIFYDTVLVTPAGVHVKSVTDTIVTARIWKSAMNAPNAISIGYNRTNNYLVMYYAGARDTGTVGGTSGRKYGGIHRAYLLSPDTDYSSNSLESLVDTTFTGQNKKFDSTVADLNLVFDEYGGEHIAIMMKNINKVYYSKRGEDTNFNSDLLFDTVALDVNSSASATSDSNVAITLSRSGSPTIVWSAVSNSAVVGRVGRRKQLALAAGTNISISNGVTSISTSPTISDLIPQNDAPVPQYFQTIMIAASSVPTVDSSNAPQLTSSFSAPTYTVTLSQLSPNQDSMVIRINSTQRSLALYARRPSDTDQTNALADNLWDIDKFGKTLTQAQITVLMGSVIILQVGDTAGNVYREGRSFADTFGVQIQFQLSPNFMRSLAAAGVDSMDLAVYSIELDPVYGRLTTDSDWTLVGNADQMWTAGTYFDTGCQLIISSPITHFSAIGLFPGSSSSRPGVNFKNPPQMCVVGRCIGMHAVGIMSGLRSFRDAVLSTRMGRVLTEIYYQLR